jgi:hypothetical protein
VEGRVHGAGRGNPVCPDTPVSAHPVGPLDRAPRNGARPPSRLRSTPSAQKKELINCRDYTIGAEREAPGGGATFRVDVTARDGGAAAFDFTLQRQEWGLRTGSWQTKSLLRVEEGG